MIYPESFEKKIGFDSVRQEVSAYCVSAMGRQLSDEMTFLTDYEVISRALHATDEMLAIVRGETDLPLAGLHDISHSLKVLTVGRTFLPAAEFVTVRSTLICMGEVADFFRAGDVEDESQQPYPELSATVRRMVTFAPVVGAINRVIDRYGNIMDSASPELAEIRRDMNRMSGRVNSVMKSVIARAQKEGVIDADTAPAMRDGRLVLPVAPMNKRKLSGIVHDESASGKTVFIEPAEVVEANNRIRELELAERREITRILTLLTDTLRPYADQIAESCKIMGELDFIHAKALFAKDIDASLPSFSPNEELEWYHACHPGLLMSLRRQNKEIVPLDITLTPEERILVISGPNAGGKSVCLKTAGIIQYMLQCGLLPSVYSNSRCGIFEDIFVDIGDDQSLESDLSTYSSHLRNMRFLLQRGRKSSLVLIDEFGGGTEPQIGGAIAQAVLHNLNDKKMWGIITTHFQNLKHFAEDTPGLINGSMLYDRQQMQPLFRLSIGNPGSSFAIEIAKKIGLPKTILEEAEQIVGSDYINLDKYLLDIARDKKYWENKRLAIRQKEKKVEMALERYESEADELRSKRREIISEAKEEAKRIIDGSNARVERTIKEIRSAAADKEKIREARRRLDEDKKVIAAGGDDQPDLLKKAPKAKKKAARPVADRNAPLEVNDVVKLDGEGTPGRIVEIKGKEAVVIFGMLKTTVKLSRLRRTLSKIPSAAKASSFISSATSNEARSRQLQFRQEIDVRGMRVDEAVQAVTYFIDDAIQFNASKVRILHGTGTGALRQCIREYLGSVSGVRSCRDEDVRFGGAGITVVELE